MISMKKILAVILCLMLCGCGANDPAAPAMTQPKNEEITLSVTAVGDNLIHAPIYREANRNTGGDGYDFSPSYEYIAPYINSDINIINQETPIGGADIGVSSYPRFNSPYELGESVVAMGFNVINHSNNHFYDADTPAVLNTMNFWKEKNIPVIGVYDESIKYVEKNGITVGLAAYCYGTNLALQQQSPYRMSFMKEDIVRQELAEAREKCDLLIVSFHWGQEYIMTQNAEQEQYAKIAAEANADLVIGHHPHVIQPVKEIARADGKMMPVAYSLGNFISSQEPPKTMLGGMIKATFKGKPGAMELEKVGFVPLVTHYTPGYKTTKTYVFDDYTHELAAGHGSVGFTYEGIKEMIDETIDAKYLTAGKEMIK